MHLIFEKVIIHNFLSYGHSEINLDNRGYCLVSGINHDLRDNSASNGSGKSTWASAICWALTGQTIQGKKNNLKNIFIDEDLCYVTLNFIADGVNFSITRYKEPKSDLKIYINGEDKSGETFRKSEDILAQYLPDLNNDLIASIIILGQGLPLKFTNNTPSGRKEVLEKLSKSDFMIQDIKNRLNKVIAQNNTDLRTIDDKLLTISTKKDMITNQLNSVNLKLEDLKKPRNFEFEINSITKDIETINNSITSHVSKVTIGESRITELNNKLGTILKEKQELINKENSTFDVIKNEHYENKNKAYNNYLNSKNALTTDLNNKNSELTANFNKINVEYSSEINSLKSEIKRLDSIVDVCPTCGQKLPHVIKQDTTKQKEELKALTEALNSYITDFNKNTAEEKKIYDGKVSTLTESYNSEVKQLDGSYKVSELNHTKMLSDIESTYQDDINSINGELRTQHQTLDLYRKEIQIKNQELLTKQNELNKVKLSLENHLKQVQELESNKITLEDSLKKLEQETLYNNNERNSISNLLDIDKKIETLIKRDFRGFLLSNVINFIDGKIKEYSEDIFGNRDLCFILDGNNIDISYLGKDFDNLSGGEKQKIDLIIQFAIRDMMSQYLDFSCNIFVLDEIFDNLDAVGCNNVLNLISSKLNDIESMFIISHHSDSLDIPYDSELTIVKDQNGISKVN